jgi:hypothetical protein
MPRTVTGVMSAVFGTAQQFQLRRGVPMWAIHLSDTVSWIAGLMTLWYFNDASTWLQTVLALASVNALAWIITAVYFLIWHDRVEHFRRVRNCLLDLAKESREKQANPSNSGDRIGEVMYGIVHAQEFIQQAFAPRFIDEYSAYEERDRQQKLSKGVFVITAEYAQHLAGEMTYADLNPEFDAPKSYEKFKAESR